MTHFKNHFSHCTTNRALQDRNEDPKELSETPETFFFIMRNACTSLYINILHKKLWLLRKKLSSSLNKHSSSL